MKRSLKYLVNEFIEITKIIDKMSDYKHYVDTCKEEFETLKYYIDTDSPYIFAQINLVDSLLMHLKHKYNYVPDYQAEYDRQMSEFFGRFKIKTKKACLNDVKFSEN